MPVLPWPKILSRTGVGNDLYTVFICVATSSQRTTFVFHLFSTIQIESNGTVLNIQCRDVDVIHVVDVLKACLCFESPVPEHLQFDP